MLFSFMFFPGKGGGGTFPMKIPLKSFENPLNLPWINSQDFHGLSVHSHIKLQHGAIVNR